MDEIEHALVSKLKERGVEGYVALAHDFFLDCLLPFGELEKFVEWLRGVAERGGGNLMVERTELIRGGCAANTASALASLGVPVVLYGKASSLGLHLLKKFFEGLPVELHFTPSEGIGVTVALEGVYHDRRVNVMITSPGPNADYSLEDIDERGLKRLRGARVLMLTSLWGNRRHREFSRGVLRLAREGGVEYNIIDTGDPVPHGGHVKLLQELASENLIDRLSLNENEARQYARQILGREVDDPTECCRLIHEELGVDVDFHHAHYALSLTDGEEAVAPTYVVDVRRLTGAGDAWNAGNIYGLMLGLNAKERLVLANAVAGYYISSEKPEHPDLSRLILFIERTPLRSLQHT